MTEQVSFETSPNLKTITKLCRDVQQICQSGSTAVRLAAQNGLQELIDRLSDSKGMSKSSSTGNLNESLQIPPKILPPVAANGKLDVVETKKGPSPDLLRPKTANPTAASFRGFSKDELKTISKYFEKKAFNRGQTLFVHGQQRTNFWIIESGRVEKWKSVWGAKHRLVVLSEFDTMGEEGFLERTLHSANATCLTEVSVWVLSLDKFDIFMDEQPKLAIKIMRDSSQVLRNRLVYSGKEYMGLEDVAKSGDFRIEKDMIGAFEVPSAAYYGVQTGRAMVNFPISGITIAYFPKFIEAFAYIKKAAAITNYRLGQLSEEKREAIAAACDELLEGKLHGHFVVDMFQGGAGTSTNMNANEVIANRALELLGHKKGEYEFLNPNDDVNKAQSTNDTYPSAIHIATLLMVPQLDMALKQLYVALKQKGEEFSQVIKMGRTQLQDAVPMTLGQEFDAWACMIKGERTQLSRASELLEEINMGATAIGTGLNALPAYSGLVTHELCALTGLKLRTAEDLIMATQDTSAFLNFSSMLKNMGARISKICNDLRILSSGPRCGFGEINLPAVQPGSSIMPGKVNPVIPEVMNQTAFYVIGQDFANTFASEAGQMELNAMEPLMGFNLFFGIEIMANAINTLTRQCVVGITANEEKLLSNVKNSIGIVTALNPYIGYGNACRVAKIALKTGGSVYDLVLQEKLLTKAELDDILAPEMMTKPREIKSQDVQKMLKKFPSLNDDNNLSNIANKSLQSEK